MKRRKSFWNEEIVSNINERFIIRLSSKHTAYMYLQLKIAYTAKEPHIPSSRSRQQPLALLVCSPLEQSPRRPEARSRRFIRDGISRHLTRARRLQYILRARRCTCPFVCSLLSRTCQFGARARERVVLVVVVVRRHLFWEAITPRCWLWPFFLLDDGDGSTWRGVYISMKSAKSRASPRLHRRIFPRIELPLAPRRP